MIPLKDCKHGFTYRIHSRNLDIGVFDETTQGFVGIREKFGDKFLFEEFHWDTGAPFGTVSPEEEIEQCPIKDIRENLGSFCANCEKNVKWTEATKWKHTEPTDCEKILPCSRHNKPLFKYLEALKNNS